MTEPSATTLVYRICSRDEWAAARQKSTYEGSGLDRRDGFIHLSDAHQLAGTLETHFRDTADLVLLVIDAARLGGALKWERSRGGERFPHLYAHLPVSAVIEARPLPADADPRARFVDKLT